MTEPLIESVSPRSAIWRRLIEQIKALEWAGVDEHVQGCCAFCLRFPVEGHEADCGFAALRACADPPEESREEQDLSAILQAVLQMIGLPGYNGAWFDEHGDWDFGKLREHGLDARLAEIRAALRACAEAPATDTEHARLIFPKSLHLAAVGMLEACAKHLGALCVGYGEAQILAVARGLREFHESVTAPSTYAPATLRAEALAPSTDKKLETQETEEASRVDGVPGVGHGDLPR